MFYILFFFVSFKIISWLLVVHVNGFAFNVVKWIRPSFIVGSSKILFLFQFRSSLTDFMAMQDCSRYVDSSLSGGDFVYLLGISL